MIDLAKHTPASAHSPLSILLIEDNPADAALLREVLAPASHLKLVHAASLAEGLALARAGHFDAVLLDLSLPDSVGFATLARAAEALPAMPIVIMTGIEDNSMDLQAIRHGAQDYLIKGRSDDAAILRSIRYAVDRKKMMVELRAAQSGLERMVEERTANLRKAVAQLEAEITRREKVEQELQRSNQVLQMVSACNEALVRASDERKLMEEICRAAVAIGGYPVAWVGIADNDAKQTVRPIASMGLDHALALNTSASSGDNLLGTGPIRTAIRNCEIQIGRDFLSDPQLEPWHRLAVDKGFRSSICLPLANNGKAYGALTICAAEPDAFDGGRIKVLAELAEDLAFGISALRTRVALRQSHDRLRALASELTLAEQRERRRLAKVLHDHLQQLLVGAKFRTAILGRTGDEIVRQAASEIEDLLGQSIDASRSLTAELSPPILHEGGLAAGLEWLARWAVDRHGLIVDLAVEPNTTPAAEDVKVLLFESVRELLFNVVKHARTRSARVILRRIEHDKLEIVVVDKGSGFDPAILNSSVQSGAGFGLFNIRERLDLIGGRLVVDSSPGGGTRISLLTPLETASEAGAVAVPAKSRPEQVVSGRPAYEGKIRILLVDDHIIMRQGLARLLAQETDFQIIGEASDGQMGVESARELRPDVILMDMSMPKLNGIDATRIIHQEMPQVRIIGLSMFEEAERAQAMCDAGASAYVSKTGASENLIAAIRSLWSQQKPASAKHKAARRSRRQTQS